MRMSTVILMLLGAGCASELSPTDGVVLTIAVVRDAVLVGHSKTRGTTGSFELQSVYGVPLNCVGKFRYSRPPDGTAFLSCDDGQRGSVRIKADGNLTGEGRGTSEMDVIHVVYGHTIGEMNERLELPQGTQLVSNERGIGLTVVAGE